MVATTRTYTASYNNNKGGVLSSLLIYSHARAHITQKFAHDNVKLERVARI